MRLIAFLGSTSFALGLLLGVRQVVLYLMGTPRAHVPSLVLAAILIIVGVQFCIFGLVADIINVNRRLLEDVQLRLRQNQHNNGEDAPLIETNYARYEP